MQYFGRIYAFVIILHQKSNTFWQTAFVKISPLELVEKNLSGDDSSVTICRAASRKKVKVPLGAEPAEDGEEDISF